MKNWYTLSFFLIVIFGAQPLLSQTFNGQGNLLVPPGAPAQTVGITTSIATVSGVGVIGTGCVSIDHVDLNFQHTFVGDVAIFLIGPGGQVLELSSGNGGGGDNFTNTVFTDNTAQFITAGAPPFTGTFRPEGRQTSTAPPFPNANPLGTFTFANTFNGTNADGNWTLLINDFVSIDWGTLISWSITFTSGGGPQPVANAGPDQTICSGQTATLTVNATPAATGYLWSNGVGTQTISVSPTVTTNYYVTVTNNGCTDIDTVAVIINPNGGTVNAGLDQSICSGQSATLMASGASPGATFTWSNGQSGSSITVSPANTSTYTVTATASGCVATDQVQVTVTPIPLANAGPDLDICEGQVAALLASGGGTYTWSNGQNSQQITVTPSIPTLYTVTVTLNGCSDTDDALVNVAPAPVVDAGPDLSICPFAVTTLAASGGPGSFLWSTGTTAQSITVAPGATTIYSVTVLSGTCSATDEVIVTVNSPLVNAGPDQLICDGDITLLTANGNGTFAWSNGQNTQSITVNPSTTTTYTVTVTSGAACTNTDEVVVTVNQIPNVNAGADQVICEGESVTLNATGGSNYLWNTGQNGASISVSPNVTTTYTVTALNGICPASDEVTVIVNPSPIVSASNDETICSGDVTALSAVILNGAGSYSWSNGQSGNSITVAPLSTSVYTVTATNSFACSATDEVVVFVNPNPVANAGADLSICEGTNATLAATGGGSYNWNSGQNTAAINVSPTQTTFYTVTVTSAAGCSDTDEAIVAVLSAPIANAGVDAIICAGDVASLQASGGGNYLWNTGQAAANISVSPNASSVFTVTVTNAALCTDTDDVNVTVLPTPLANAGPDQTLCLGESADLLASGGGNYAWSSGQSNAAINVSPAVTTAYSVTVSNNGCAATDAVTVFINPIPAVNAGPNVSITTGETATLSATGNGTFVWSNGQSGSSISVSPSVTTTYTVTITLDGCSSTDEVTVFVNEPPQVDLGPDQTICAGESLTISAAANGQNNSTFIWTTGDNTPSITVSPVVTTDYGVTVTANGLSTSDVMTVFVNTVPLGVPAISGEPVLCSGAPANYGINPVAGATSYLWTLPAGASILSGQGTTGIEVDWGNAAPTTLNVVASNACGNSPAGNLAVQINTSPPTPGPLDGTLQPCELSPATYAVPSLPDALQYNWTLSAGGTISAGQGTSQISVNWGDASGSQQLCVFAENACGLSAPLCQDITATAPPTALAGTDDSACGTSLTLNATGSGTWSLDSGPGTANFANANSPSSLLTVSQPGVYSLTWTTTQNGCTDSDQVSLSFFQNPATGIPTESCNATNDAYTVSFSIAGGQAPYFVNGLIISGSNFTSALIASGDPYSFTVTDANGCEAAPVNGIRLCNCGTDAGSMAQTLLDFCQGEVATADDALGALLDGNDVLAYALTDGTFPPNILALSATPSFAFNDSLSLETVYFIAAIVGNNDGSGLPDLDDPCLSVAAGTPVVFHALPTATISGDASLCPNDCAPLNFSFTGNAPFSLTYGNGSGNLNFGSALDSGSENVCPNTTTTYTLVQVSDAFCDNSAAGTVTMSVAPVANSGVAANPLALCAGNGQLVNLPGLLTGASPGGTWNETSTTPSTGGAFNATAANFNPAGQAPGTYQFAYEVAGQAGCPTTTTSVTVVIQALPIADAGADAPINCAAPNALLGGSGTSTGVGISYLWSNGATSLTTSVSQSGNYTLTVTTAAGCSASDAVNVSADFAAPNAVVTPSGTLLTCDETSQTLAGNASTPAGLSFAWLFNGGTLGNGNSWLATSVGCYELVVTNPANGCKDTTSVCISEDVEAPTLSITAPGQLTCLSDIVSINANASAGGAAISYAWTSPDGNIVGSANAPTCTVDAPGGYNLLVTNLNNGCSADASTSVIENTTAPTASASAQDALDCNTQSTVLSGAGSSTGANFQYEWNTPGGQISGNAAQLNAEASAAGLYELIVTNLDNGCTASASTAVVSVTGNPSALDIELAAPKCFGECNGALLLDDLGAGLLFALDGGSFSTQSSFADLCGGTYQLQVQDAFGCEWDTLLLLPEPPQVIVSLGADTTISLGDSIRLIALTANAVLDFSWSPANANCDSLCAAQWVRPFEATRYFVTVTDAAGCSASDDQLISVKKNRSVFVPNAFSPNDDGINDVLMVFTGADVAAVRSFRIFSRWGESLMERFNVRPGHVEDGWNGRFRDQRLNPAVFIYMLEVEYVDGRTELLKGDVTLVH